MVLNHNIIDIVYVKLIQCVGLLTNSFIPSCYVKSWVIISKKNTEESYCLRVLNLKIKNSIHFNNYTRNMFFFNYT